MDQNFGNLVIVFIVVKLFSENYNIGNELIKISNIYITNTQIY